MKIFSIRTTNNKSINNAAEKRSGLSFGAMKKHEFDGIDFAVVEKYKAPIEKFNSNDDLQKWAGEKINNIKNQDYGGRLETTQIGRSLILKQWFEHLANNRYSNTQSLIILSFITRDLKPNNDVLPPVLNNSILRETINEADKNIRQNNYEKKLIEKQTSDEIKKLKESGISTAEIKEKIKTLKKENKLKSWEPYLFDFNKKYTNKLQAHYLKDTVITEQDSKWIVIPSKENNPLGFSENVKMLQTLSHKNWCTKTTNALPYLQRGDFHIYFENGQPKLGVRFIHGRIEEIQGELNNDIIPNKYFELLKNYIEENSLELKIHAQDQIDNAEIKKEMYAKIQNELKQEIEDNNVEAIMNYFEIECKKDKDGRLIISEYKQPDKYNFADIGIDENRLFEKIYKIEGDADFKDSDVTNLGNLHSIEGDALFKDSKIYNLGNLSYIGGDANFKKSQLTNLCNLQEINGNAYFTDSNIKNLNHLKSIGGCAIFKKSNVTDTGDLESIGGNANFTDSKIKSLKNIKYIGGNTDFSQSSVITLGKLEVIGGNVNFSKSDVETSDNLRVIKGDANFMYSNIKSLYRLEEIGGNAYFMFSYLLYLGNLKTIGNDADFRNCIIKDINNLKDIGGNANFRYSNIDNIKNLEHVGGVVYLNNESKLSKEDFNNVKVDGGISKMEY